MTKTVEDPPGADPVAAHPAETELRYRLVQQALLGEFGRYALQERLLMPLLERAAEWCAIGLRTTFSKVLEYDPHTHGLVLRAGTGWRIDDGAAPVFGVDPESPAGFAYQTGQALISNHLHGETRFRTPQLLADHGIKRAINVLIQRGGEGERPFGVLEVDSPDPGRFDRGDAEFLAGFAGLLGIAIERQATDARLLAALEQETLLTREMSHRVKNSLSVVASLLQIQARAAPSDEVRHALEDARSRVTTVAEVHDHLWRGARLGFVRLDEFLSDLCRKLEESAPGHGVACAADPVVLPADQAVPLGLVINELVTNAVKYAYPEAVGEIRVSARREGRRLAIEVADDGRGLPEDFDIARPRQSLGLRVIANLVRQLEAEIAVGRGPAGARFTITMPLPETTQEGGRES